MRKFKPNFERDYKFYLDNIPNFNFSGTDSKMDFCIQYSGEPDDFHGCDEDGKLIPWKIPYSEKGKPAKIVFHRLDSEGKGQSCFEPELLVKILTTKASVNLHIKMWSEGWAECTLNYSEIQEMMTHYGCPEWVYKAIENQKEKILKRWIDNKDYLSNKIIANNLFLHRLGGFSSNEIK